MANFDVNAATNNDNGGNDGDNASGLASVAQPAGFIAGFGNEPSRDSAGNEFDPAIHSGLDKRNADGTFRRKRGRKSGSGGPAQSKRGNNSTSVNSLASVLLVLHMGIASATKTPELALDESEANSLAQATANVLNEFDIQPNPKVEAIIALGIVAGSIYGPRAYVINERIKGRKNNESSDKSA